MIGQPNSKAEESKIQIGTGLFVLLIHLFVTDRLLWHRLLHLRCFFEAFASVCTTFLSVTRTVAFSEPLSPSQWTYWNGLWSTASWIDQYHTGQQIFLGTLQTVCEKSDLTANPVLFQPCRSHVAFEVVFDAFTSVCTTFLSVAKTVAFYKPLSPSQWTYWNSILINITQVNKFSWHTSNWLWEKQPRSKLCFTPTL